MIGAILSIRFCVEHELFDLHDVNAMLLQEDQKTLTKEAATRRDEVLTKVAISQRIF
jgi:hypothetical protein